MARTGVFVAVVLCIGLVIALLAIHPPAQTPASQAEVASSPGACPTGQVLTQVTESGTGAIVLVCSNLINNRVTSTYTTTSVSFSNIAGLSFALTASTKYQFTVNAIYSISSATKGGEFAIGALPAGATFEACIYEPTAITTIDAGCVTTTGTTIVSTTTGSTTDVAVLIVGSVIVGANAGTLNIQGAVSTATGGPTMTVEINSWIQGQISTA